MQWRLSGLLADVAGRFGGSVVFAGRTGLTMRNMRKGKNPQSAGQTAVRAAFALWSSFWRSLSAPEILAWNQAAKLIPRKNKVAGSFTGSGASFFSAVQDTADYVNVRANADGQPDVYTLPLTVPPVGIAPVNNGNVANFDCENVGGVQAMVLDIPKVEADNYLIVEMSAQVSAGRANAKGLFRPIQGIGPGAATPGANMLAKYQAVFGNLIGGKQIFVRARLFDTTECSPVKTYAGGELSGTVKIV